MTNSQELKFVFDDELRVQDKRNVCVDGYLWATDFLVNRLSEQEGVSLAASANNINFYPVYNVAENSIVVKGSFGVEGEAPDFAEKRINFDLFLQPEEQMELYSAMEAYCLKQEGMGCREFVNKMREHDGLSPLNIDSTVEIYQLKPSDHGTFLLFLGSEALKKRNIPIDGKNYDLKYSGPMVEGEMLDEIYERFNIRHPVGYLAHSLSVSDVVCVKTSDISRAYFVDNIGFKPLPNFLAQYEASRKPRLDEVVKGAEARKDAPSSSKDSFEKDIER